jgi:GntR family transcriptional regulator
MLLCNCASTDSTVNTKCIKGSGKLIVLDYRSRTPIYEQIKEQIIMLINEGVYKPNEQLPSIRSLSTQLGINVNTIKRAFAELEHDGITYSAQGRGIFVADNPIGNEKIKLSAIDDLKTVVLSAKTKGVSKSEICELIDKIYREDANL